MPFQLYPARRLLSLVVFSLLLHLPAGSFAADFYVATNGDDANPGTLEKPFATLVRARDEVRTVRAGGDKPVTVHLRGGVYYLSEPLVFTADDSGSARHPVVYRAYADEKPTLSGGVPLDGEWQRHRDAIFKCNVPLGVLFDQLFVNGQRRMRARFPNFDPERPLMGDGGYVNATGGSDEVGNGEFYYDPATFSEREWANPQLAVVHIFASHYWHNSQYFIERIERERNAIVLGEGGWQTFEFMAGNSFGGNSRYFIDNVFEELDAPNEWYLDAERGLLFFIPAEDVDLETATVVAPQLKQLIEFRGSAQAPVRHIELIGFRYTHTAATYLDKYEVPSTGDWGIHRGGTLFFSGAEDCAVKESFFDAVGGNAVFISDHNRRIHIAGNKFAYTGDSAVCICGKNNMVDREWKCEFCGTTRPWDFVDVDQYPAECLIDNNVMHHIGVYGKQTAGVFMSITRHNTIRRNHIHDMPRAAICINDPFWGGHVIEYNDIHDTVQESDDHGPFNSWGRGHYWCLGINRVQQSHEAGDVKRDARYATVVRNNRFRDSNNYGIVMDDGAARFHVYNNLCIGVGLQNREGEYRVVENNIFLNASHGIGYDVGHENNHDQFLRNIVVINVDHGETAGEKTGPDYRAANAANAANAELYFYRIVYPPLKGKWIDEIDYNVLFDAQGDFPWLFVPQGGQDAPGKSWEDWQALGYDRHSVRDDPRFLDAAGGDYRVHKDSPALKLGFENFPTSDYGVGEDHANRWGN
ncbi:right-handed parallel beta-helix repeat-containing protein [Pirellulales bacterium]|nr:right-handed parallel beta-helix repeat-containing protein [Pirellulales bacterium]